jgi:hypothetical protein
MNASIITALGLFLLITYSTTQLLKFYGVSVETYGLYLVFYLFLLVTAFILPRNYSTL